MTAERLARDVIELAERWTPDLIIRETTEYGGILACAGTRDPERGGPGAPRHRCSIRALVAEAQRIALDDARVYLGLDDRVPGGGAAGRGVPGLHRPSGPARSHGAACAWLAVIPTGAPERARLAAPRGLNHLGKARPLVYATLGTVFNSDYALPFFPAVIEGLRDMPLDLLVSVGPGVRSRRRLDDNRPTRGWCRTCPNGPSWIDARLVICHGGYGTVLDAVDAAVPLVVVPFGADQYINAESVARLEIGRIIDEEELTAARVREAASAVDGRRGLRSAHRGAPGGLARPPGARCGRRRARAAGRSPGPTGPPRSRRSTG